MRIYYDFHIHSALSPCASDDMTPSNIILMAKLKGLDAIAVSDHNSVKNVRSVINASKRENGPLVLPAMEITTSEDIHILILFKDIAGAEECEKEIKETQLKIKNKKEVFGAQLVLDEYDNIAGEEEYLLIPACGISAEDAKDLALRYGGAAAPAHVDKQSNSLISILGAISPQMNYKTVEISKNCGETDTALGIEGYFKLHNSDAHYLEDINERENNFMEVESLSAENIIKAVNEGNY